jgi:hypothetical protein
MNYFEYTVEVEVTEDVEKKTKQLFDMIKEGRSPFNLFKLSDEVLESDEKKKIRTFTLTSLSNINPIVLHYFSGNCAKFYCFYKTPVMM